MWRGEDYEGARPNIKNVAWSVTPSTATATPVII